MQAPLTPWTPTSFPSMKVVRMWPKDTWGECGRCHLRIAVNHCCLHAACVALGSGKAGWQKAIGKGASSLVQYRGNMGRQIQCCCHWIAVAAADFVCPVLYNVYQKPCHLVQILRLCRFDHISTCKVLPAGTNFWIWPFSSKWSSYKKQSIINPPPCLVTTIYAHRLDHALQQSSSIVIKGVLYNQCSHPMEMPVTNCNVYGVSSEGVALRDWVCPYTPYTRR